MQENWVNPFGQIETKGAPKLASNITPPKGPPPPFTLDPKGDVKTRLAGTQTLRETWLCAGFLFFRSPTEGSNLEKTNPRLLEESSARGSAFLDPARELSVAERGKEGKPRQKVNKVQPVWQ